MSRVDGGFANRVYRLNTDQGSFAVKELNVVDRRWTYRAEEVFAFERAAFSAGVPMPEPISADERFLIHRWVEAEAVPEAPVSVAYAFEIGQILRRVHGLDVGWMTESVEDTPSGDWPELAERAAQTGQPWANELASTVDTFLEISRFIETCERPGPVVLTHRDIHPWNLLDRDGRPVVLDWELSGPLDLAGELGSTALSLAKGPGLDDIDPAVFRAVLDGYTEAGGALPPPGPHWFVFMIDGWLGHTRWNILRCIADVETSSGPDLALSQESARNGVRGLPNLFGRIPQLETLLLSH
jgi:aminoglycoside phosphotransferase (APT) family kinase protein